MILQEEENLSARLDFLQSNIILDNILNIK